MEFRLLLSLCLLALIPGYSLAAFVSKDETPNGYHHWSGAWRFNEDADTVKGQLPSLARQAYEEMIADAQDKGASDPSTMAALAVGSIVYFSSGLIGGAFLVNPGSVDNYVQDGVAQEVHTAIFRCQQSYGTDHRYDARCAEPLVTQQFLVNNPTASIVGQGTVSTYGVLDRNDRTNVGILNPCSTQYGRWGCQVFVDKLQIGTQGSQGDKPDLPTLSAPAEELPHCFWT